MEGPVSISSRWTSSTACVREGEEPKWDERESGAFCIFWQKLYDTLRFSFSETKLVQCLAVILWHYVIKEIKFSLSQTKPCYIIGKNTLYLNIIFIFKVYPRFHKVPKNCDVFWPLLSLYIPFLLKMCCIQKVETENERESIERVEVMCVVSRAQRDPRHPATHA